MGATFRTLPLEGRVAAQQPGGGLSPPHLTGRQTPTPSPSPQGGGENHEPVSICEVRVTWPLAGTGTDQPRV